MSHEYTVARKFIAVSNAVLALTLLGLFTRVAYAQSTVAIANVALSESYPDGFYWIGDSTFGTSGACESQPVCSATFSTLGEAGASAARIETNYLTGTINTSLRASASVLSEPNVAAAGASGYGAYQVSYLVLDAPTTDPFQVKFSFRMNNVGAVNSVNTQLVFGLDDINTPAPMTGMIYTLEYGGNIDGARTREYNCTSCSFGASAAGVVFEGTIDALPIAWGSAGPQVFINLGASLNTLSLTAFAGESLSLDSSVTLELELPAGVSIAPGQTFLSQASSVPEPRGGVLLLIGLVPILRSVRRSRFRQRLRSNTS